MKRIILILIIIMAFPIVSYANAGPPIIDPIDQSIVFNEGTGISLVEEWVSIKFVKNGGKINLYKGSVSVKYRLMNLDNFSKKLDLLFISPEIEMSGIRVSKDGSHIQGVNLNREIKSLKNWNPIIDKEIIDPVSKKPLYITPSKIVTPKYDFYGIEFSVSLEPNEVIELNIEYESPSGIYRQSRIASPVYSQIYYLTPARFWEGSAKVNLELAFPEDSFIKLHSNIPMEKINKYTYKAEFDGIPQKEWIFTVVDNSKLIFKSNNRLTHNSLVVMITLLGIGIGILSKKKNKFAITIFIWLISLLFFIKFILPSYGTMFLICIFGPWILLILAIIFAVRQYNKCRLNKIK